MVVYRFLYWYDAQHIGRTRWWLSSYTNLVWIFYSQSTFQHYLLNLILHYPLQKSRHWTNRRANSTIHTVGRKSSVQRYRYLYDYGKNRWNDSKGLYLSLASTKLMKSKLFFHDLVSWNDNCPNVAFVNNKENETNWGVKNKRKKK